MNESKEFQIDFISTQERNKTPPPHFSFFFINYQRTKNKISSNLHSTMQVMRMHIRESISRWFRETIHFSMKNFKTCRTIGTNKTPKKAATMLTELISFLLYSLIFLLSSSSKLYANVFFSVFSTITSEKYTSRSGLYDCFTQVKLRHEQEKKQTKRITLTDVHVYIKDYSFSRCTYGVIRS